MKLKREETRELLVELTTEELLARGQELSAIVGRISLLEDEKARLSKSYAAQITTQKVERDRVSEALSTGRELRPVPCEVFADVKRAEFVTFRTDTGEEVSARTMTERELKHERQADPPLPEDAQDNPQEARDELGDESGGGRQPETTEPVTSFKVSDTEMTLCDTCTQTAHCQTYEPGLVTLTCSSYVATSACDECGELPEDCTCEAP
jgi:hypothetical protein